MQKTMAIVKNGHKRGFGRGETGDNPAIAYFIPLL